MGIEDYLKRSGVNPDEVDRVLQEARPLAIELEKLIPNIGFLSLSRRVNAYLVVTGHLSSLLDDGSASPDVASIAHSLLLEKSASFRKSYQAFVAKVRSGGMGIGTLNSFTAMQMRSG
jgi:hypothetical protein